MKTAKPKNVLQRISVKNLAIVPQAVIEFGKGLNVLTGETGSGKSILIEAIALLAGQKASSQDVRKGESQAFVEGVLQLHQHDQALAFLNQTGIEVEDDTVILKRIVHADGKSKAYINQQSTTVSTLAQFAEFWLDVTSQHAHQRLMDAANHLQVVDDFAQAHGLKNDYQEHFAGLKQICAELNELFKKKQKAKEEQDYWTFQLKELEELQLIPGEIENLQADYQRISNSHKLSEHMQRVAMCFENDGVGSALAIAEKELHLAHRLDQDLEPIFKEVEHLRIQTAEVGSLIQRYVQRLSFHPDEIEKLNARLSALQAVVRKYGSIEQAIAKRDSIRSMLSLLDENNEEEQVLLEKKKKIEVVVEQKAQELTKLRKKSSTQFCKQISQELKQLGMEHANIDCLFSAPLAEHGVVMINGKPFSSQGQESIDMQFSPNPGEGWRRLVDTASGGELSRILLAIKSIAIQKSTQPVTYLFDEVDSGIGGETADRLGLRLSSLAQKGAQVLCVTHLAQVACYASQHIRVQKITQDQRTATDVVLLNPKQRQQELARMIGGIELTDKVMAHAAELLRKSTPGL